MRSLLCLFSDGARVGLGRRTGVALIALQLVAAAFEMLGLVSFVPIFQYLSSGGDVVRLASEHQHWRNLVSAADLVGIKLGLGSLLLLTFGLLICRQALTLGRSLYEHATRETAIAGLRARLFQRFLAATLDQQDAVGGGHIVADMTQNAQQAILNVFGRYALVSQLAICAVYVSGMVLLNLTMTCTLLAIIGLAVLVAAPQILESRRLGQRLVASNKDVANFVVERLKLARLVRISRMERPESEAIGRLAQIQRDAMYRTWRAVSVVSATIETLAMAVGLLVVYVAVSRLGLGVEIVGVFLAMLLRLLPVVQQIAKNKQAIDSSRAAFESVSRRVAMLSAAREPAGGSKPLTGMKSGIRFEHVTYSYAARNGTAALDDICLEIPAHRMTALVGPSGAGKSTLVDLLPRLRLPTAGVIAIDGAELSEFDLESLRKGIAYLSQTPLVFDVAMRDHIAYGQPDASQRDIEWAARLAGIHEVIAALPDGYATRAGEGGNRLSGGQRQRLDLARALLSRASILILDEPAASLDADAARHFHQALARIRAETDTTILIISHDLAAISGADQIVVLREGRIEAAGSHENLLRQGGWYAQAWRISPLTQRDKATVA